MKKHLLLSIVSYDTYCRNECIEETYHSWSMVIPAVTWVLVTVVWWKCVCVCVSVCVPTYVPNIPKSTTSEDASTNSGWFNLEKSCPQIQPISISRNTWKPPLKSGASYQAYIVSGKVLNLTLAAIFLGWFLVSTTNNGDSRSVKSQGSLQRSARFRVSGAHTDATDVKGQVANEVEILRYP